MTARRYKSNETVDFVVVGSGAAGGVMARELSQAGFSVLVFEQGPRYSPADFEHDELNTFSSAESRSIPRSARKASATVPTSRRPPRTAFSPRYMLVSSAAAATTSRRISGASMK